MLAACTACACAARVARFKTERYTCRTGRGRFADGGSTPPSSTIYKSPDDLRAVPLSIKWPLGHVMLDFPFGHILLYWLFVVGKPKPAALKLAGFFLVLSWSPRGLAVAPAGYLPWALPRSAAGCYTRCNRWCIGGCRSAGRVQKRQRLGDTRGCGEALRARARWRSQRLEANG